TCRAHGRTVGDAGMSVDAANPDRMIGNGCIERRSGRELLVGPAVLIPAAAKNPVAWHRALGALSHARDDLVVRRRADDVDGIERQSQSVEMAVRVGEAG